MNRCTCKFTRFPLQRCPAKLSGVDLSRYWVQKTLLAFFPNRRYYIINQIDAKLKNTSNKHIRFPDFFRKMLSFRITDDLKSGNDLEEASPEIDSSASTQLSSTYQRVKWSSKSIRIRKNLNIKFWVQHKNQFLFRNVT